MGKMESRRRLRFSEYAYLHWFMSQKPITLSQDEIEMNMRLLGAQTIKDVTPEMVDASAISMHIAATPGDRLYDNNCEFIT
jgi:hypothetical protein